MPTRTFRWTVLYHTACDTDFLSIKNILAAVWHPSVCSAHFALRLIVFYHSFIDCRRLKAQKGYTPHHPSWCRSFNLHAHSVHYAHKLTTIRRALEKAKRSQGLGLEQGPASHPLDPHYYLFHQWDHQSVMKETRSTSRQCAPFSFIDAGSILLPA